MPDTTLPEPDTQSATPHGESPVQAPAPPVVEHTDDSPPMPAGPPPGRVLFAGQAYYNTWYLSRALQKLGWEAHVLNWDTTPENQHHYHGEDFTLESDYALRALPRHLRFYLRAVRHYDLFHFSNMNGIRFSHMLHEAFKRTTGEGSEIRLLKRLGKKVVYSGNGCLDAVKKSSFAAWGDRPVCDDCKWRDRPDICSDELNMAWGKFRNEVADYQVLMGGNEVDYNDDPTCHNVPEYYCLDPEFWSPELVVPGNYRLGLPDDTVKIYHGVGNFDVRSDAGSLRNIKSSHIYFPLVEQLKDEGHDVELIFFKDVPNKTLRYYQAQADIICDMLTLGYYGAGVREGLMLGKPVVCFMRPEWMEKMRSEIPDYVDEMPIVSATPETVHDVLVDLIENPAKRAEIGRRSREFALKWLSADAAAAHFDKVYRGLLAGESGANSFR